MTCAGCGATFETIRSQMERRGSEFRNKFHDRDCWKAWRVRNRQTRLEKLLKQQYGMTLEDYQKLLDATGGVCGICLCSPTEDGQRRLVVDHDHATGRVRGLICRSCNLGLGYFKDDLTILLSALKYLEAHRSAT